jgi:hypothetical protein
MRWWEVSRRHGVPKVSHDGSGFDSHANVVLGYTRLGPDDRFTIT